MKLEVERRTLRLRSPLETSYGTVAERDLALVSLSDSDGVTGYGEAAPLEAYDGVSTESVLSALQSYAAVLADGEDLNGAQMIEACRRVADIPAALAALDLAMWDRAGRRAGRTVAALLCDDPVARVPVNATITATDRAGAAEQAAPRGPRRVQLPEAEGRPPGRCGPGRRRASGRGPRDRSAPGRQRRLGCGAGGARDRSPGPGGARAGRGAHPRPAREYAKCASGSP